MITLSAICICALPFVSMFLGMYDKEGVSSSETYDSGKQTPFRSLLNAGSRTVKHIQRWQYLVRESGGANLERLQYLYNEKVDRDYVEKYPEVDRPASPVARSQGQEPICWMFAAASLLRTKQRVPTPHENLVDEMMTIERKILRELRRFWGEFKRQYDVNKAEGMRYWMESEWWQIVQSPEMKRLFPQDWTALIVKNSNVKSFLGHPFMQILMTQKFWNLHGFSFKERFSSSSRIHDQETMIQKMLQNERALIAMSGRSFETVKRELPDLLPAGEHGPWHTMMLDTFKSDTKTGEYIVKNSHGPTGGSKAGSTNGRIHIPEGVFNKLEYWVYFIGEKTPSAGTLLEKNDWMQAVAALLQSRQGKHNPLQEIVAEVEEQWYTYLAFSAESELIKRQFDDWSIEQEKYWRRTEWWGLKSGETGEWRVTEKFYRSKGLQLSGRASERQIITMKERLAESKVPSALIFFDRIEWKRIVSKFTNFFEINGDASDPGEPQLMVLQGFVQNEQDEGTYMLQDTHGINEGKDIQIPEEVLHRMVFKLWFVEDRKTHTFIAKGKHSSDLQDVYRVDFIDLETKQEKWFAINVMEEIEINRQNEMEGDIRIARGFDVFVGKETHSGRVQLNRRRILQGQALKIEWDATSIQVTNIQVLSTTRLFPFIFLFRKSNGFREPV